MTGNRLRTLLRRHLAPHSALARLALLLGLALSAGAPAQAQTPTQLAEFSFSAQGNRVNVNTTPNRLTVNIQGTGALAADPGTVTLEVMSPGGHLANGRHYIPVNYQTTGQNFTGSLTLDLLQHNRQAAPGFIYLRLIPNDDYRIGAHAFGGAGAYYPVGVGKVNTSNGMPVDGMGNPTLAVGVASAPTSIMEGGSGRFTLRRSGATLTDGAPDPALQVYARVSFSGDRGFSRLYGARFGANRGTTTLTVDIPADSVSQNRVATLTILSPFDQGSSLLLQRPLPGNYLADSENSSQIFSIVDDAAATEPPTNTVIIAPGSDQPASIRECPPDPATCTGATFTFERLGDTSEALLAYFEVKAENGSYRQLAYIFFFATGADSAVRQASVSVEIPAGSLKGNRRGIVRVLTPAEVAGQIPTPGSYGVGSGTLRQRDLTLVDPGNSRPALLSQIPDQRAGLNSPFSYQVPADTFRDPDDDPLVWTATLEDGSALPSWLGFTAATRTFSGTTPATATSLVIKVEVTDGNRRDMGMEMISTNFRLTVADPASRLAEFSFNDTDNRVDVDANRLTVGIVGTGPQAADPGSVILEALSPGGHLAEGRYRIPVTYQTVGQVFTGSLQIPLLQNNRMAAPDFIYLRLLPSDDYRVGPHAFGDGGAYYGVGVGNVDAGSGAPLDSLNNPTLAVGITSTTRSVTEGAIARFSLAKSGATATDSIPDPELQVYALVSLDDGGFSRLYGARFAAGATVTTVDVGIPADTVSEDSSATLRILAPRDTDHSLMLQRPLPGNYAVNALNGTHSFTITDASGSAPLASTVIIDPGTAQPATIRECPSGSTCNGADFFFKRQGNTSGALQAYFEVSSTDGSYRQVVSLAFTADDGDLRKRVAVKIPAGSLNGNRRGFIRVLTPAEAMDETPAPGSYEVGSGTRRQRDLALVDPSNSMPVVLNRIPDQQVGVSQPFSFQLPLNTFRDPDDDQLTWMATLGDGTDLPSWLDFTAATRTFSGTTPATATTLAIKVDVTEVGRRDMGMEMTSDSFMLTVTTGARTNRAPTLTQVMDPAPVTQLVEAGGLANLTAGIGRGSGRFIPTDADWDDSSTMQGRVGSDPWQDGAASSSGEGVRLNGAYGELHFFANGFWSYTLDNGRAVTDALLPPDSVSDTFSFRADDGDTDAATRYSGAVTLTITITGANDAPDVTTTTQTVREGETFTFSADLFTFEERDRSGSFQRLTVTGLPDATAIGTLAYQGSTLMAASIPLQVPVQNLGQLVFTPSARGRHLAISGATSDIIMRYTVSDGDLDSTGRNLRAILLGIDRPVTLVGEGIPDQLLRFDDPLDISLAGYFSFNDNRERTTRIYRLSSAASMLGSPTANVPRWLQINADTGRLTGRAEVGVHDVMVTAGDGVNSPATSEFNITVRAITTSTLVSIDASSCRPG